MSMDRKITTAADASDPAADEAGERASAPLAGSSPAAPPFNVAPSRAFLSAYARIENLLQGRVCYRELPGGFYPGGPRKCQRSWLLDVAGSGQTGDDGSARFLLTDVLCEGTTITEPGRPIGMVATPLTNSPTWLTTGTALVNLPDGSGDVEIRVFSWRPGGSPDPRTWFSWRLLVPGYIQDPDFGPI